MEQRARTRRRRRIGTTGLLALILVSCGSSAESEIQSVFDQYRSAMIAGDGVTAESLLNQATRDWYTATVELAGDTQNGLILGAPPLRKLMVLQLRTAFFADELHAMTSADVYCEGLKRGWISTDFVAGATITKIDFKGPLAWVYLDGQLNAPAFTAVREGDQWKLSLIESIQSRNTVMKRAASSQSLLDGPYLRKVLEAAGTPVSASLFQRPRTRVASRPAGT